MDPFSDFFFNKPKKFAVHKWHHYFEIYDRHFSKFKGKNPVIVEIGVQNGGSIEMWNDYFKGECTIYGIDINTDCKNIENSFKNVKILIGDQNDDTFLNSIKSEIPQIDILIDDGSHINSHIIKTFEYLYNNISMGGVYFIEDVHTSYWNEYGGGNKRAGTIIEYSKNLIDNLNSKHIREQSDNSFSNITDSLHFYDSIIIIEKRKALLVSVEHSIQR